MFRNQTLPSLIITLLVLFIQNSKAEDWPHFLAQNFDLHSAETGLNLKFPVEGPPKLWEFAKGKGHAPPIVVADLVYLIHLVDQNETITCIDSKTGRTNWQHAYPVEVGQSYGITDMPRSSPSADLTTRTVFTLGNNGHLIAFDMDSGDILWQFKLSEKYGEAPQFFGQGSAPLLYKDKLIVHVGADNHCIVALEKKTGKEIWKTDHHWNGSYASPIIAKINNEDRVLLLAGGKTEPPHGGLLCVDPENGTVNDSFKWRSENFASVLAASPVACGPNQIFITEDYGKGGVMLSYDDDFKSTIDWSSSDFACQFQTPIYHNGVLYGSTGRGEMMAFDSKTGQQLWTDDFSKTTIPLKSRRGEDRDVPISLGKAHMIHVDGTFLCLSENGTLLNLQINRDEFKILAKSRLFYAPETWAPPVISNARLFVNQNELGRRLICYDLQ